MRNMSEKTKIYYLSTYCSPKVFNVLFESAKIKPRIAAQKFNGLLMEGLGMNISDCEIDSLSAIPVTTKTHEKKFWRFESEINGNLRRRYIPLINMALLKEATLFFFAFFSILFWDFFAHGKRKVIICDTLNLSISLGALFASKLIRRKIVAIVTDVPDLMLSTTNSRSLKHRLYYFLVNKVITNYDAYVLLTKQMGSLINVNKKPFIVIEGLVDHKQLDEKSCNVNEETNKTIIYSGGVYEEYGIKKLVNAICRIEDQGINIHIYGDGDMVTELKELCKTDKRIIYKGVVPNNDVVMAQKKASLLVNPRPADLELSAYSFPSKTLEYMVSGTPVLTTRLKGIPEEYFNYVYSICNESETGISETLQKIFQLPNSERVAMGARARKFVLENKNNKIQGKKLLLFINSL